jgi:gliding motility-associated peptidyl-prolyl isomerase
MRISSFFVLIGLLLGCSQPEARKPVVRKTSSFMSESIERNKILTKAENQLIQKQMEGDSLHTYLNSEQGFWYYYEKKDSSDAPMPVTGDQIVFNYEVRDLADQVIFSEEE